MGINQGRPIYHDSTRKHGVARKLLCLSLILLIPDLVMLSIVFRSIQADIVTAQREQAGLVIARPAVAIHGMASTATTEEASDAFLHEVSELARAQKLALVNLGASQEVRRRQLQHSSELLTIAQRINSTPPAARVALYRAISEAAHAILRDKNDLSGLILDPVLGSYYVMDLSTITMPMVQKEISLLELTTQQLAASPSVSSDARESVGIYMAGSRQRMIDHVQLIADRATSADALYSNTLKNLNDRLQESMRAYEHKAHAFLEAVEHRILNPDVPAAQLALRDAARDASNEALHLARQAMDNLDAILDARIATYAAQRNDALLITAGAALAAFFCVRIITRTINRPLLEQAESLKRSNEKLEEEMLRRTKMHEELVAASRQAGMAEIATGVLHNVGNVLNSVNVSTSVLETSIAESKAPNLSRVAELIRNNREQLPHFLTNDDRGKQLPTYLESLGEVLNAEHEAMHDELVQLRKSVDHINAIIVSQQTFARKHDLSEPVSLNALIEDSLQMSGVALQRHGVVLVRELNAEVGKIITDRHATLQVLTNLLTNARKAVRDSDNLVKRITVTTQVLDAEGEKDQRSYVRISVRDTGVGIDPANLEKIFQHGFTTRTDGHGFGLHASANDANRLGGRLLVESPGLGQGAVFSLDLPLQLENT